MNTLALIIGYGVLALCAFITIKYVYIGVLVYLDYRSRSKYRPAVTFLTYLKSRLEEL